MPFAASIVQHPTFFAWGDERSRIYNHDATIDATPGSIRMTSTGETAHQAHVPRAVTEDPTDLEQAFARCSTSLYRYLWVRTGHDGHLADDLMQQLWLKTNQSAAGIRAHEIEFWLKGVAKNLIREHWRKKKRVPRRVPIVDHTIATELARRIGNEELPDAYWQRREVMDQLLLAVTDLGSAEQELIVAHYFRGESQADLATRWSISERAVEGRLYRVRRALRRKLECLSG